MECYRKDIYDQVFEMYKELMRLYDGMDIVMLCMFSKDKEYKL